MPRPLVLASLLVLSAAGLAAQTTDGSPGTTGSYRNQDDTGLNSATDPSRPEGRYQATADQGAYSGMASSNWDDGDTRSFLKKAAKSGMKEVTVSQSVRANLKNADVQAFADRMVKDHTKANKDLKDLARRRGVELPAMDEDLAEDWRSNNHDADEDYIDEMIDDHQDAVDLFADAVKNGDTEIARFANEYLPTLRDHLAQAKQLKKEVD